ncbi:hypothetical protein I6F15_25685, partial [Bradyrhizobium sp. BRP14]|nr:hypothetical protein [Bradyrhizobium sp. BRP14]
MTVLGERSGCSQDVFAAFVERWKREGAIMERMAAYVGLDVHKDTIAIAVAEAERNGEIRSWGTITNTPSAVDKMLQKLRSRYTDLEFAHEAGPTG